MAELNWSTAKVQDGKLKVELDGGVDKDWKQSFKTTVRLLGGGEWGEVELKKNAIRVTDVTAGSEEKLRHYLESVVEQANASQAEPEEEADGRDEDTGGDGPDAEMTRQFRSFGESVSGEDSDSE